MQQDKTPPVPGDGGGLGLSAFCDCQVSRTRIAYHLHRRKGCKRASNLGGGLHHHEFANLACLRILDLNGVSLPNLLFNEICN